MQAAINHGTRLCCTQAVRHLQHVARLDAAGVRAPLGRVGCHGGGELLKARGIAADKIGVVELLLDEDVCKSEQKRQVGAGAKSDPPRSLGTRGRAARIDRHHLAPAGERLLEDVHRVGVAGVERRSSQVDDVVGMGEVGMGRVAQRVVPPGEARVFTGSNLGIHVRGAQCGEQAVEIQAGTGSDARGAGECRCPVAPHNLLDALGDAGVCLLVARGHEFARHRVAHEGREQSVGIEVRVEASAPAPAQTGRAVGVALNGHTRTYAAVVVDVCAKGAVRVTTRAHGHDVVRGGCRAVGVVSWHGYFSSDAKEKGRHTARLRHDVLILGQKSRKNALMGQNAGYRSAGSRSL